MTCRHARLIADKVQTWQWCRDCGSFRERQTAVWNAPSQPQALIEKLKELIADQKTRQQSTRDVCAWCHRVRGAHDEDNDDHTFVESRDGV